ncbi:MAG: putative porin [Acidobacteriota bacterium]|nr:MAG: putative porin [Acidobacteriota bacterium]
MYRYGLIVLTLIITLGGLSLEANDQVDRLLEILKQKGILNEQEVTALRAVVEEEAEPEVAEAAPDTEEKHVVTTVPQEKVPAPQKDHSITVGEKVKFSGDLRNRYDAQFRDTGSSEYTRGRGRYRLRFGIEAQPTANTRVGFRLASGNGLQNTTNQSFDGFSRGNKIFIDRVYASWDPTNWFRIVAGKHSNPFLTSSLVWDSDVNMQGLTEVFKYSGERAEFKGTMTQYLLEEVNDKTGRNGDPLMLGYQGSFKAKPGGGTSLDLGLTCYDFRNMNMLTPGGIFLEEEFIGYNNMNGQQMVFDEQGRLLNEWDSLEFNARFKIQDVIGKQPLGFFGTYIKNTSADIDKLRTEGVAFPGSDPADLFAYGDDERDSGYQFGAEIGFNEKKGDLRVQYFYQVLEDFAFPAVFVDSDFHGGGTNNRGHRASVNYFLKDNIELQGIFFFTQRENEAKDGQKDENRIQLDLIFEF